MAAERQIEPGVFRTSDTRTAGFLHARGLRFVGHVQNGAGETVFRFDDTEGAAVALADVFPSSAEQRYDASCKMMFGIARGSAR